MFQNRNISIFWVSKSFELFWAAWNSSTVWHLDNSNSANSLKIFSRATEVQSKLLLIQNLKLFQVHQSTYTSPSKHRQNQPTVLLYLHFNYVINKRGSTLYQILARIVCAKRKARNHFINQENFCKIYRKDSSSLLWNCQTGPLLRVFSLGGHGFGKLNCLNEFRSSAVQIFCFCRRFWMANFVHSEFDWPLIIRGELKLMFMAMNDQRKLIKINKNQHVRGLCASSPGSFSSAFC